MVIDTADEQIQDETEEMDDIAMIDMMDEQIQDETEEMDDIAMIDMMDEQTQDETEEMDDITMIGMMDEQTQDETEEMDDITMVGMMDEQTQDETEEMDDITMIDMMDEQIQDETEEMDNITMTDVADEQIQDETEEMDNISMVDMADEQIQNETGEGENNMMVDMADEQIQNKTGKAFTLEKWHELNIFNNDTYDKIYTMHYGMNERIGDLLFMATDVNTNAYDYLEVQPVFEIFIGTKGYEVILHDKEHHLFHAHVKGIYPGSEDYTLSITSLCKLCDFCIGNDWDSKEIMISCVDFRKGIYPDDFISHILPTYNYCTLDEVFAVLEQLYL